jgi:hypothetical protein
VHATHNVPKPLTEFVRRPTLEDIGALCSFAQAVENVGDSISQWGVSIHKMLSGVDDARRDWDTAGADDA